MSEYKPLNKRQLNYLSKIHKHLTLIEEKIFTEKQLNKLIEMVACTYMYNEDMKTGSPQEQRLLKNIYFILTGSDDPNEQR